MGAKMVKDHKGNVFNSVTEMCEFYGIGIGTYQSRLKKGWDLQRVLEAPRSGTRVSCTDHKGNKFASKTDMCKAWGVSVSLFDTRSKLGWDLQRILETPRRVASSTEHNEGATAYFDHKGNKYGSVVEMLRLYGIPQGVFYNRIKKGWSLQQALETPPQDTSCVDHKGNKFSSIIKMTEYWGIPDGLFRDRIKRGWSLKDALETKALGNIKFVDHLGNKFLSKIALCQHWNIPLWLFDFRVKSGFSMKEALTSPMTNEERLFYKQDIRKSDADIEDVFIEERGGFCYDHKGNKFNTISEMCNYYGVSFGTFSARYYKLGWTLKEALERPKKRQVVRLWTDPCGRVFETQEEMCNAWGIPLTVFHNRVYSYKWSIEKALTTPIQRKGGVPERRKKK